MIEDIVTDIQAVLPDCDDLRLKEYRGNPNFYVGHCYVASEAIYHIAKNEGIELKPMFVWHENCSHWYLLYSDKVIDPTSQQFTSLVNYGAGRGKGFLTKGPSKRAKAMIARVTTKK